jgi:DNA mismatch repair protein MutS
VAKLAGLPKSVLVRANELLSNFEGGEPKPSPSQRSRAQRAAPDQLSLFHPPSMNATEKAVLQTLHSVDVNRLSPIDALTLIAELKTRLSS